MADKINKPNEVWRGEMGAQQYHVCREQGTEPAFTGKYWNTKTSGMYHCSACGEPLFSSQAKFDSGTGWPSFYQPMQENAVESAVDNSHGMTRTEVHCRRCGSHLGHVFADGPQPTGLRYCINSISLDLQADG